MSKDDIVEIIIVSGLMLIAVIIVVGAFIASLNGHLGTGAGDTLHDLIMSICTGLLGFVIAKKRYEKHD
jgi:hypothetical protein